MNAPEPALARAAIRFRCLMAASALTILGATGCERRTEPGAAASEAVDADGLASTALVDYYVRQKTGVDAARVPPGTKAQLVEELTRLRAAAMLGEQRATPETLGAVELARLEIFARAAAETAGVFAAPSDAELQAAYDAYVKSLPPSEFHARHILVPTEELAHAVIAALDGGAGFAELAAQRSAEAESATRGGDLGWIRPGHLPEQFFNALGTLQDGEYTRQPVKTAYGWHVIGRIESRVGRPLPLDQVRAQLATNLLQQRYQQFLETSVADEKEK